MSVALTREFGCVIWEGERVWKAANTRLTFKSNGNTSSAKNVLVIVMDNATYLWGRARPYRSGGTAGDFHRRPWRASLTLGQFRRANNESCFHAPRKCSAVCTFRSVTTYKRTSVSVRASGRLRQLSDRDNKHTSSLVHLVNSTSESCPLVNWPLPWRIGFLQTISWKLFIYEEWRTFVQNKLSVGARTRDFIITNCRYRKN